MRSRFSNQQRDAVSLVVAVDAENGIWLEGEPIDITQVRSQVKSLSSSDHTAVVINADKSVNTGRLIAVLDQIRLAGVDNVAVATAGL